MSTKKRTRPQNDRTKEHYHELPDGRTVRFFLNVETRLVVVDVIDKDEKGGVEILRRNV